jgi:hypothetical protein
MNLNRRSVAHARPRRSGARMAFVFAAALAIFLQVFVVQTHVHASGLLTVAAHEQGIGDSDNNVHVSDPRGHANRAICDIIVSACHTTLTTTSAVASETRIRNETAALEIRRAPRALTHSWQSRAPPIAA